MVNFNSSGAGYPMGNTGPTERIGNLNPKIDRSSSSTVVKQKAELANGRQITVTLNYNAGELHVSDDQIHKDLHVAMIKIMGLAEAYKLGENNINKIEIKNVAENPGEEQITIGNSSKKLEDVKGTLEERLSYTENTTEVENLIRERITATFKSFFPGEDISKSIVQQLQWPKVPTDPPYVNPWVKTTNTSVQRQSNLESTTVKLEDQQQLFKKENAQAINDEVTWLDDREFDQYAEPLSSEDIDFQPYELGPPPSYNEVTQLDGIDFQLHEGSPPNYDTVIKNPKLYERIAVNLTHSNMNVKNYAKTLFSSPPPIPSLNNPPSKSEIKNKITSVIHPPPLDNPEVGIILPAKMGTIPKIIKIADTIPDITIEIDSSKSTEISKSESQSLEPPRKLTPEEQNFVKSYTNELIGSAGTFKTQYNNMLEIHTKAIDDKKILKKEDRKLLREFVKTSESLKDDLNRLETMIEDNIKEVLDNHIKHEDISVFDDITTKLMETLTAKNMPDPKLIGEYYYLQDKLNHNDRIKKALFEVDGAKLEATGFINPDYNPNKYSNIALVQRYPRYQILLDPLIKKLPDGQVKDKAIKLQDNLKSLTTNFNEGIKEREKQDKIRNQNKPSSKFKRAIKTKSTRSRGSTQPGSAAGG